MQPGCYLLTGCSLVEESRLLCVEGCSPSHSRVIWLKGLMTWFAYPLPRLHAGAMREKSSSGDAMQGGIFFPDRAEGCLQATLDPGSTLLIPSSWPHAVVTQEDAVVVGGNFLHALELRCISASFPNLNMSTHANPSTQSLGVTSGDMGKLKTVSGVSDGCRVLADSTILGRMHCQLSASVVYCCAHAAS